ncbi:MAG: acetyl-CoA carboxylase carboxyl transferase subunit beta [Oscillospiraceae bacterium]|nr:acetyl-CoA carboxylase carboxyl transferase subunit beta [Oscillospiraceae bacterium]
MISPFSQRRERLMDLKTQRESKAVQRHAAGTCSGCGAVVEKQALANAAYVCPHCGRHHTIGAYLRLSLLFDPNSFAELDEHLTAPNILDFPGYEEKRKSLRRSTGLTEAVVTATGAVDGQPVVTAVLDSRCFMGSMWVAVLETLTRWVVHAATPGRRLRIFSASGGARMQEGILSLMQMAKTSAALARFSKAGGLYISYLTHPTTGGVTASFASLGDITLAEPGALIGFAGPRVIEQTIGQKLPEGFQRSEYLEEHGFIDQIVPRAAMRETLSLLLRLHRKGGASHG